MHQTINPYNESILASYHYFTKAEIAKVLQNAENAFSQWKQEPIHQRTSCVRKLGNLLLEKKQILASLITQEMGKPIAQALAEIEKCANMCFYYAEQAATYLAPKMVKTNMQKSYVVYQPLGVILGIIPWNFPFWQVFRYVIPTICAGNTSIFKHSPNCFGSGEAIAELFLQSEFPKHTVQHAIIDVADVEQIIAHPSIAGVNFTGSNKVGAIIAAQAGKALKKTVLELGGSDPYIVFADADLDLATDFILNSRLLNAGQVCVAAKRIIILQEVYDSVKNKILEKIASYIMGDPLQLDTRLGPLARQDLRIALHEQVHTAVQQGAKLLSGGYLPDRVGYFYPITVLEGQSDLPIFQEEIFGPVISLFSAKTPEEAIKIANNTPFGLAAGIFSQDLSFAEQIAVHSLDAGNVVINGMMASDPRLPFGGIKQSGWGRELAEEGLYAFANVKAILIP